MTDLSLQRAIMTELQSYLTKAGRALPWASGLEKLHVYGQSLPIKSPGSGVPDDDGDSSDQWNYICVVLDDEDLKEDTWTITVHFSMGIKDMGKDCQGHQVLCNLMNEIWLHFVKLGIVAEKYSIRPDEAHKRFGEAEYPYYVCDLITYWELKSPGMEGLEDLL